MCAISTGDWLAWFHFVSCSSTGACFNMVLTTHVLCILVGSPGDQLLRFQEWIPLMETGRLLGRSIRKCRMPWQSCQNCDGTWRNDCTSLGSIKGATPTDMEESGTMHSLYLPMFTRIACKALDKLTLQSKPHRMRRSSTRICRYGRRGWIKWMRKWSEETCVIDELLVCWVVCQ